MFKPIHYSTINDREVEILHFWKENDIFNRSLEERKNGAFFSTYDGPPFATGLPHYGHFLAGTIKDVVLRYKTMQGYYVPRRFGWDCHGLPVEQEVEKSHNLSGAQSIEEFGIANFNEACRNIVLRYAEEWKSYVLRMGRFVDFSNTYHTMDCTFMESVWWVFKELYEKGLVYQGFKVMPFSAKLGTPLSNFEAGENYKEVDDPSITIAFPLKNEENCYFLAWTTTPWTLISNRALMVNPDITYVKVQDHQRGKIYILAEKALEKYFKKSDPFTVLDHFSGSSLEGTDYIPPFDYFNQEEGNAYFVLLEKQVSLEEGTGIVHSAPSFGELDFEACKKAHISLVCPVDNNGKFTSQIPEYQGLFVKDADKPIIASLKNKGLLFHQTTCRHRYPFCWRSDTPLIYKAVSSWFVSVETLKERLMALNEEIHWTPQHLQKGRFGKWLEGARDWAISRNRYWGTPIPLWKAEDGTIKVIGSIQELEQLTGTKIHDLHRHFIDELTFEEEGKVFKRIPEVFDCWFESGAMPYAQSHYPFENKELFKQTFPADFIAEGLDQTRGWFYTLTILAGALFNKPAFKNVIVNGIILAEDGNKMSKRLKNYPDPLDMVEKYGADAIRLYMMHSPAVKADDLRFAESGVALVLRQILIPFYNAYSFFITYARIYDWKPQEKTQKRKASIDQWLLSLTEKLAEEVQSGMENYDLSCAVEPLVGYIDQLTNWYIRRSRRRFWSDVASEDRDEAFATLYSALLTLTKIAAPFTPFLAETIYQNLKSQEMEDSVHLSLFPSLNPDVRRKDLEEEMQLVQRAVKLGHALRKEHKLKVRQPLASVFIACGDSAALKKLQKNCALIEEELNVKTVEFLKDEEQFVLLIAKPHFRLLGKKLGKNMRAGQLAIENLTREQLEALQQNKDVDILIEGEIFTLTSEDILVQREVKEGCVAANDQEITLALNTQLTPALIEEALAREVINKINTMRREQNFDVTDRIQVVLESTENVRACYVHWKKIIHEEVLATSLTFGPCREGLLWDLNGEETRIFIQKEVNPHSTPDLL
jgi:isoleucyl-tRNA synthetase